MERNSFVFYGSFFEAIKELEDKDKGIISYAIMQYGLTGESPKLRGYLKSMFLLIKPQIDANNKKYENGCLGGRPSKAQNNQSKTKGKPKDKQTESKAYPNEDVDVDVNVDVNENEDVDVKGKGDCKGKNQRVSDRNGKNNPNDETDFSFVERQGTAKETENDKTDISPREKSKKANDRTANDQMANGFPLRENQKATTAAPPLASPEIIRSTSVETFKARVEYAKSLGIEEGVAVRICNLAQSEKFPLCEMHYKGFVGKSGKEIEEGFNLLNLIAKKGKNSSGLKRINSS